MIRNFSINPHNNFIGDLYDVAYYDEKSSIVVFYNEKGIMIAGIVSEYLPISWRIGLLHIREFKGIQNA